MLGASRAPLVPGSHYGSSRVLIELCLAQATIRKPAEHSIEEDGAPSHGPKGRGKGLSRRFLQDIFFPHSSLPCLPAERDGR